MKTEKQIKVRVDKWLWAARFFKTRSIASRAVSGGKVQVNQTRAKPSRSVDIGDVLTVTKGELEFEVTILKLADKRCSAREAVTLYEESEKSITKREEQKAFKKMIYHSQTAPARKPDKRDRRKIREFIRKE